MPLGLAFSTHPSKLKPQGLSVPWVPLFLLPCVLGPLPVLGLLSVLRLTGLEESAWGDEEDIEHNYYNSIPGKEPPLGGLVDSRLTLTQPCTFGALGALSQVSPCGLMGEGWWQLSPGADSLGLVPSFLSAPVFDPRVGSPRPPTLPSSPKLYRSAPPCSRHF